jgi:hypothetical protein
MDITHASFRATDAARYLAMAAYAVIMAKTDDNGAGWPLKRAIEELTDCANSLGFVLVPIAERAAEAEKVESVS